MNRCRTCKWWDHTASAQDAWGNCDMVGFYCDNRHGDKADPRGRDHPESLAVAQDAEGYAAGLRTSPDFGCVQWVGKP